MMMLSRLIDELKSHFNEYGDQEVGLQLRGGEEIVPVGGTGTYTNLDREPPLEMVSINSVDYMQSLSEPEVRHSGLTGDNTDEELIAAGYRCISRKYGVVARIDREDWMHVLREGVPPFLYLLPKELVKALESGQWQDHYRRRYSKDQLRIGSARAVRLGASGWDPTGYVEV